MTTATPVRTVVGPVVRGDRRGRRLGFPTANVRLQGHEALRFGVYAGRLDGRPAAISVGVRPTFGDGLEPLLEAHVLDFAGDLYDAVVTVEVGAFLREERSFDDVGELVRQMRRDVEDVRRIHAVATPDDADHATVAAAIRDLRRGRMVLLTGGAGRETETDLVMAADAADADAVNFMAREARGLICLALRPERCDALRLPQMRAPGPGVAERGFTVSVEAREGITTGISAADRARTIAVTASADAQPDDVVMPGHMFPFRTAVGGVRAYAGHPEAGLELVRHAERTPAAVTCTVLDAEGEPLTPAGARRYAAAHGLVCVTVEAVVRYVASGPRTGEAVERRSTSTPFGVVESFHHTADDDREIVVAIVGDPPVGPPVPLVLQRHDPLRDVLGVGAEDDPRGASALRCLRDAGGGMLVHLGAESPGRWEAEETPLADPRRLARILLDLGAPRVRQVGGPSDDLAALAPFGVTIEPA